MRLGQPLCLLAALVLGAPAVEAKILHSKESALRLAFPDAEDVKPLHLFLEDDHVAEIERLSQAKVRSKLVTVYVGRRGGRPIGFALIDTHVVRTLPETFMTVLDLHGRIQAVHILAFHEPQEYMPSSDWLAQFRGRRLSRSLAVRYDIAGIAGSTLSAYALTSGVRKCLALYRVLLQPAMRLAQRSAPARKVATTRDPG